VTIPAKYTLTEAHWIISDMTYALRGLSKHTLGEAFGADAGACWCDPFYRGDGTAEPVWPGHTETCAWIRALPGVLLNVEKADGPDEGFRRILDVVTGWTRPMTDAEKLDAVKGIATEMTE